MNKLLNSISFYVCCFSAILSILVFTWAKITIPSETLQVIRLTQIFAFTAVIFLYISLLIEPIVFLFPNIYERKNILKSRLALYVSIFFFAELHTYFAFFKQLGGFFGIPYLGAAYIIPILFGLGASLIFFIITIIAIARWLRKIKIRNKRLITGALYLAGIFIIIHGLILGTHFHDLSTLTPNISFAALGILLILDASAADVLIYQKNSRYFKFTITIITLIILLLAHYEFFSSLSGRTWGIGIHSDHTKVNQLEEGGNLMIH